MPDIHLSLGTVPHPWCAFVQPIRSAGHTGGGGSSVFAWIDVESGPSPDRPICPILQQEAGGLEFVADAIGRDPVLRLAGRDTPVDQRLDLHIGQISVGTLPAQVGLRIVLKAQNPA